MSLYAFRVAALVSAALITGCQSTSVTEMWASARPATDNEKSAIIDGMRDALHDPYSVRDVEISEVITATLGGIVHQVCVRGNAKNAYGGYTGRETYLLYMNNAAQVTHVKQGPAMNTVCPRLKFSPFPEAVERLQKL